MKIIKLNLGHLDDFCRLRLQLFQELNEINITSDTSDLEIVTKEYYTSHIDNDLICWGIELENKIVAIASLCLLTRIPYADNLSGKEGYLLNVYTAPTFRKKGLSTRLVHTIIDYSKNNGINRLWLSSSEQGRNIYKSCGFIEKNNEMELFLNSRL